MGVTKSKKFSIFEDFLNRVKGSNKRIVLPEGNDDRVIEAAILATKLDIARITILGDEQTIIKKIPKQFKDKITIINPNRQQLKLGVYANTLYELRKHKGMTISDAMLQVKLPIVYATMMLKCEDADGIVAGVSMPTAEAVRPAFQIIKTEEGINKISSVMIMQIPDGLDIGENGVLIFADCGIIPEPTSEDLADIALASANTARRICGITPKIAMLSYSTNSKTNTEIESVEKVKRAVKILNATHPELLVEGEVQADTAIVPEVAKLKFPDSKLKGRANVLVFPDLNSANIAYKLVQRIAKIEAVGPLLQGLKKPVNDMSRGASATEMCKAIAITVLQSNK